MAVHTAADMARQISDAAVDLLTLFESVTPRPYSRTVLAIAAMRAVDALVNGGPSPVQGAAREVLSEEACRLWMSLGSRETAK